VLHSLARVPLPLPLPLQLPPPSCSFAQMRWLAGEHGGGACLT